MVVSNLVRSQIEGAIVHPEEALPSRNIPGPTVRSSA